MMRQDDVLERHQHVRRKRLAGLLSDLRAALLDPLNALHDVPQQLPLVRVLEIRRVAELARLPRVVQEHADDHQIAADRGVERANRVRQPQQVERVLQQPAAIGVVHLHRRGRDLKVAHERLVADELREQREKVAILHRSQNRQQFLPHGRDVLPCAGQKIGGIHAAGLDQPHAVDDELAGAFVALDAAAQTKQAALGDRVVDFLRRVPHARQKLAGVVGQDRVDVEPAVAGGAQILLLDTEDLILDAFAGGQLGDAAGRGGIRRLRHVVRLLEIRSCVFGARLGSALGVSAARPRRPARRGARGSTPARPARRRSRRRRTNPPASPCPAAW